MIITICGKFFEYRFQQYPAMRHGGDFHPLAGRMGATDVGAEGKHVEPWMAGCQQATFEAGMNGLKPCRLAEFTGIDTLTQGKQPRYGVGCPSLDRGRFSVPEIGAIRRVG